MWVVLRLVWKVSGVVGVALQGPDAVVMGRRLQGVGDGMGQHRVGADLDEGGVVVRRRR